MSLFRVDSSIRTEGSVSRAVADSIEAGWRQTHPGGAVERRDLAADPIPATAWTTAIGAGQTPADQRTPEQAEALALVAAAADELAAADAVVIGAPLYNFGVPQFLKAWIDLLILDERFAPGAAPLAGKQVALVVARGGGYAEGTPRHGWDHATGWLRRILGDVWGGDVTVVEAELTMAAANPSMADLIPLAEQSKTAAHELAATTGRTFAERVLATV
ncbi:FMN-dependent NADH-azoreductase [Actinokineospora pegani]|uniref:FMN-dependent NADH-azoreductase n=1 Tax=Actinokineospora pegani TaxID=2654637 RepID=UPI0012EA64A8|nr:NAD(P)H-dependent oxidoreductase [Actinokineospora pegani]